MITLEQAARNFTAGRIDESKIKTKVRRLYDIANVLASLGLIEKTHLDVTRKPAFKWVGEHGFKSFLVEMRNHLNIGPSSEPAAAPAMPEHLSLSAPIWQSLKDL